LAAATPALAQNDVRAAYNAAFQDMLNKPSDPATVVRFVALAERVGDFKGAIAALERLLLTNPDQPRVQTELAALYLKIGLYDAAKTYADAAIASSRANDATREEARQAVTDANDRLDRSKFSGDLFLGLQYSSNANSGSSGLVLSNGTPVVPTPGVSGQPDWGLVSGGLLHHRYDLRTDDHAAIESDLAFYSTRYFTVSSANLGIVDLKSGPRFDFLPDSVDRLTARPFFTGRYVTQGDLPSYWAYGTGIDFGKAITEATHITLTTLARRRDFQNTASAPTNSQSSGTEIYEVLGLQTALNSWVSLYGGGSALRYIAAAPSQTYQEYGGGFSAIATFGNPLGFDDEEWSVTLAGNVAFAAYDAPDPTVDPSNTRTQRDLSGSLVLSVPIRDGFSLVTQATYTNRAASIVNYAYNAATVMVGGAFHF
jgi:hypothetical protein